WNDSLDQFELDGQLLIHEAATQRYHTEQESFKRIIYDGSAWHITNPDGTVYHYGARADNGENAYSKLRRGALGGTGAGHEVFRWVLDKVTDPRGNSYLIDYYPGTPDLIGSDSYATNLYPARIRYSDHAVATPGNRKRLIQFVWDQR